MIEPARSKEERKAMDREKVVKVFKVWGAKSILMSDEEMRDLPDDVIAELRADVFMQLYEAEEEA